MKKLIILAVAAILTMTACTKESNPTLEQTAWQYSTEISNTKYSVGLVLSSSTHGYATIYESPKNSSSASIYQVYDVKYTFDGEESGTISFRKEFSEGTNTSQFNPDEYTDTITTSFYTYAGNNKMLIHDTPNKILRNIELTAYNPYSLTNQ